MATTTFSTGIVITSAWLNDADFLVYDVFGGLSSVPSSGKIFRSNGTNMVASTATFADTYSVSTLLYAASANTVSGLATANSSTLQTNGSGAPSWVAHASALGVLFTAKGDLLVASGSGTADKQAVGTDGYALTANSGATTGLQYLPPQAGFTLLNGYLDWSVAGNVLTVAIKGWDGNSPSATNPVFLAFRSATVGTGSPVLRKLTAATSISINDTATLGTTNSTAFKLWCVAFDDGGTVRLALINCLSGTNIYPLGQFPIASSTLEDNASDSAHVFYSDTAAVTSKAYTVLGYASWESGLATAGTWSAAPTRIQLYGPGVPLPGHIVQEQSTSTGAVATGTASIPYDDTIPQSGEMDVYMSQAITPTSAANVLDVQAEIVGSHSVNSQYAGALFQDAGANALCVANTTQAAAANIASVIVRYRVLSGQTTSTTFKAAAAGNAGATFTFNGYSSARTWGGRMNSWLNVREIMT